MELKEYQGRVLESFARWREALETGAARVGNRNFSMAPSRGKDSRCRAQLS